MDHYCAKKEKNKTLGAFGQQRSHSRSLTLFFFPLLPSGHTVVIDRLTRAEWFLSPPRSKTLPVCSLMQKGKEGEKIRNRKKDSQHLHWLSFCNTMTLTLLCRNKRKSFVQIELFQKKKATYLLSATWAKLLVFAPLLAFFLCLCVFWLDIEDINIPYKPLLINLIEQQLWMRKSCFF